MPAPARNWLVVKFALRVRFEDIVKDNSGLVVKTARHIAQQHEYRLSQAAVADLRKVLRGALLQPTDAGYCEARSIWNGMITKEPALIARVSGVSDVVACVNFARENRLPLSIRGGGHNITGNALCDHGLIGTASFSGSSQASAMIWQICSGVKVAGAPQRGASLNRSAIPAAASAAVQRRRQ